LIENTDGGLKSSVKLQPPKTTRNPLRISIEWPIKGEKLATGGAGIDLFRFKELSNMIKLCPAIFGDVLPPKM
jgi:hypothetical protein